MPNIKSAKKRVKVIKTKHDSNIEPKGAMKAAVKVARAGATDANVKTAKKRIDKALNKGLITKNKAARLKSSVDKKLNETK